MCVTRLLKWPTNLAWSGPDHLSCLLHFLSWFSSYAGLLSDPQMYQQTFAYVAYFSVPLLIISQVGRRVEQLFHPRNHLRRGFLQVLPQHGTGTLAGIVSYFTTIVHSSIHSFNSFLLNNHYVPVTRLKARAVKPNETCQWTNNKSSVVHINTMHRVSQECTAQHKWEVGLGVLRRA